jgi:hypothetical protein
MAASMLAAATPLDLLVRFLQPVLLVVADVLGELLLLHQRAHRLPVLLQLERTLFVLGVQHQQIAREVLVHAGQFGEDV